MFKPPSPLTSYLSPESPNANESFSDYGASTFGGVSKGNGNGIAALKLLSKDDLGMSLGELPMADSMASELGPLNGTFKSDCTTGGYEYSTDEGSPYTAVSRPDSPSDEQQQQPPFSPRLKPKSFRVSKWRRVSRAAMKVSTEASQLWKEATDLHQEGHYFRANVMLTKCIDMQPLPEYHSSRSMTWLALNNTVAALKDAMQAVERSRLSIEKYLTKGNVNKQDHAAFLEHYYRRGICFSAQGGTMGSQLALHDFKVASTQSIKLGLWKGDDPEGWDDIKDSIIEEYEEEARQYAELSDEEEYELEELDVMLERRRLGLVLDSITEKKADVAESMVGNADDFDFSLNWKSLPMNHTTRNILLPKIFTPDSVARVITEMELGNKLHRNDFIGLLTLAREILLKTANIPNIPVPEGTTVHVVGDIHGQFHDLLHILQLTGFPSNENVIIFNGDFVDRGAYGVECITILLLLKVTFPEYFHVVRGNHEDHAVNEQYHFLAEVLLKYGSCDVYHAVQGVFKLFPLAHVVGGKIFVVHGGVPGGNVTLAELEEINRNKDVPDSGYFCNMLWSDPADVEEEQASSRGRGVLFGKDVTQSFLNTNDLSIVIRSHDVTNCVENGYHWDHDGLIVTVFSAPNYGSCGNKASIAVIDHTLVPQFKEFGSTDAPSSFMPKAAPHPYHFNFSA